jgi:hypothetical protein
MARYRPANRNPVRADYRRPLLALSPLAPSPRYTQTPQPPPAIDSELWAQALAGYYPYPRSSPVAGILLNGTTGRA